MHGVREGLRMKESEGKKGSEAGIQTIRGKLTGDKTKEVGTHQTAPE